MPTISVFYGITVVLRLRNKEHNPPHLHAYYGGYSAVFSIETGEMLQGLFTSKGKKLVKEFILKYQNELLEMWATNVFRQLPGLE